MTLQVAHKAVDGKMYALARHARAVVVNERPRQYRYKRIITQAPLHDALAYVYAFDVSFFAALNTYKRVKAATFEFAFFQLTERVVYVRNRVYPVSLRACFPTDTQTTLFVTVI